MILWLMPVLLTLSFIIKKHDIRNEMKEELKRENLQKVVLKKNEVKWVDDHEIWINNRMFDIKSKKIEGGVFIFIGLFDEEETELMQNENEAEEKKNDKTLVQFLKLIDNSFYNYLLQFYSHFESDDLAFFYSSPEINFPFCEIITPPPQGL